MPFFKCSKDLASDGNPKGLLTVLKWFSFVVCVLAFGWNVLDSFLRWQAKEIGTKIDLVSNVHVDGGTTQRLPAFAVCRHPQHVLSYVDRNNRNLKDRFNLSLTDMMRIEAYEKIEAAGNSYQEVFDEFLFLDSNVVKSFSLGSRSKYVGMGLNALSSNPVDLPDDWNWFFHPRYGSCTKLDIEDPELIKAVGPAGIDYYQFKVDFDVAFKDRDEPSREWVPDQVVDSKEEEETETGAGSSDTIYTNYNRTGVGSPPDTDDADTDTDTGDILGSLAGRHTPNFSPDNHRVGGSYVTPYHVSQEQGFDTALVVAYDPQHFLTTLEVALTENHINQYYVLEQDIIDKTGIEDIYGCEADPEYNEDKCLYECLRDKFVEEFGCLHASLYHMLLSQRLDFPPVPACTSAHLSTKTKDDHHRISRELLARHVELPKNVEFFEAGLFRVQELLAGFQEDGSAEKRCSCQRPCKKKIIKLSTWKNDNDYNNAMAFFQFQPFVKIYSYHLLHTGGDFVSDIGGYLGLFLGLSLFGLVEMALKVWNAREKLDSRKQSKMNEANGNSHVEEHAI